LRYQRNGTGALQLEGKENKENKGKNKRRCMEWTHKTRTSIKVQNNINNKKNNAEVKGHPEVDMDDLLKKHDWKEIMLPYIQQHGEEPVMAAIQLMNLSNQEWSTFVLTSHEPVSGQTRT
jgi:hypothetical protein